MNKLSVFLYLLPFTLIYNSSIVGQSVSFSNVNLFEDSHSSNPCAVDMNGDFLDDIVVVKRDTILINYQQMDGSFELKKYDIALANQPDWSICAGDIDNNGFNDLLFGGQSEVSFIYANEDGTAYTEDAKLTYIFSQRSTFADIDNDGHLDAFVCHDTDQSHPYRNDGTGELTLDKTLIETINLPGNYSAIWIDYDNDRDIDLYVTKCRGGAAPGDSSRTNAMYSNNGDGTFTEVAETLNLNDNSQSWSTVFEDFDNDGDLDAFIVNHDFGNRFMIQNEDGTFTNVIESTGIPEMELGAWENLSADFNNDGYVDLLTDMGDVIYLNNGDLTFTGIPNSLQPRSAIADLNNDGYLDVYGGGQSAWLNDGGDNNWIKINLIGEQSNRNGIGSRIELKTPEQSQLREV